MSPNNSPHNYLFIRSAIYTHRYKALILANIRIVARKEMLANSIKITIINAK